MDEPAKQPPAIPAGPVFAPPDQKRHGIEILPPHPVASPHGIEFEDGQEIWWKPSWGEIWQHLGYRRWLLVPMIGFITLCVACYFDYRLLQFFWLLGVKWSVFIVAIPFGAFAYGAASIARKRHDPFCIHCGYSLTGLPDLHHCPECGRRYSFLQCDEYRRDPAWFIQRWRRRHEIPPAHGHIIAGPVRSKKRRDGT